MNKRIFLFVFLIAALVLSACGEKSALAEHRDQWKAQNINHYRFELTISCFCPFFEVNPVTVEVLDGKIVSMSGADGKALSDPFRSTFEEAGTVEALFDLAGEYFKSADKIEVTYDAEYGFPVSIVVDQIELAMDDEITYRVENFTRLP
ncbi:MAG: hypothetical protein HFACDABA_02135 [Anaerolineales bacterium]|nr:hypothetical protein [Anaerolineales bacterium]